MQHPPNAYLNVLQLLSNLIVAFKVYSRKGLSSGESPGPFIPSFFDSHFQKIAGDVELRRNQESGWFG